MEGAQAKALYGLTFNYKPLHALVDRLLRDSTLSGEEVAEVLDGAGLVPFPDPFVEGFTWDENGRLVYPGMEEQVLCLFPSSSRVCAPVLPASKRPTKQHKSWRWSPSKLCAAWLAACIVLPTFLRGCVFESLLCVSCKHQSD